MCTITCDNLGLNVVLICRSFPSLLFYEIIEDYMFMKQMQLIQNGLCDDCHRNQIRKYSFQPKRWEILNETCQSKLNPSSYNS